MNLRQRRGLMFLGGSTVFLVIGASALSSYVSDVQADVGPRMEVVVLDRAVEPFTPLTEDDLEIAEVPERWAPERAITSPAGAIGLVASSGLDEGAYLTEDILGPPPLLAPDQREIAILIDAETGVAGKVRPGSRVDIVATFGADEQSVSLGGGRAEIIVSNAQVIDVGELQVESDEETFQQRQVVPVTFALSVTQALTLAHAESFAAQVRLALVPPDDEGAVPEDERLYPPLPPAGGEQEGAGA